MICSYNDCKSKSKAKSFCDLHYARYLRNGTPERVRAANGGAAKHPNYRSWNAMKRRCYDTNSNRYEQYGARGITICDRWLGPDGFWTFVADMGIRPANMSIEREDNDGNYEPSNCKWATIHQQTANRRNSAEVVGVNWIKKTNKWGANLMVNRVRYYLGTFDDKQEAIAARKAAELAHEI